MEEQNHTELERMRSQADKCLNDSVTAAKNDLHKQLKTQKKLLDAAKAQDAALNISIAQNRSELAAMTHLFHQERVSFFLSLPPHTPSTPCDIL